MAASRMKDAPGNIRSGQFVIGDRGNILNDDTEDSEKVKTVRVLIRRKDGKFLCVRNYDEKLKIGFPGGGVDAGELEEDAAIRELWEETGLIADNIKLIDVDLFMDKEVSVFLADDYEGRLKSSEEGQTGWCSIKTLVSGFYGEYYSKLFKKLGYI